MAIAQDRLVRKEVSLGAIRNVQPPLDHIGLRLCPFLAVESDDVVFEYVNSSLQDVLAPARAPDAESQLMQFDEFLNGTGKASVLDWAYKNKYTDSDVTRYRNNLTLSSSTQNLNLTLNPVESAISQFNRIVARDDARRKRSLDNRLEWLVMTSLDTGQLVYNDGRVQFTVNWGRPSQQNDQAPAGPLWDAGVTHDPIGDIKAMQQYMWNTYQIKIDHAITSQKVLNTIWKSNRFFAPITGIVVGGTPSAPLDINYLAPQYNEQAAINILQQATGVTFEVYDSIYQTRPIGSTTVTNQRFTNEKSILFMPSQASLGAIDDTEIGFSKMLTSPHSEGNWQSGFYEWEAEEHDPWMHVRGSGIKAFPVFPYMQYTYSMDVLA